MLAVTAPYQQFWDSDGSPLDSGYIYFGEAGENPETDPVTVYWDEDGTQPAAQPIRTLNGYPMRNGSPGAIFSSSDYSVTVKNSRGVLIVYSAVNTSALNLRYDINNNYEAGTIGYKLKQTISVKDFGALGDGTTDDTASIQEGIDYIIAAGGGALYFPAGTYQVSSTLVLTNGDNLKLYGDGPDASIIRTTSATANVFFSSSTDFYQTFDNFRITSSVTRTAGAYFDLAFVCRGMFSHLKLDAWFHCFLLRKFEQTTLFEVRGVNPSGAGNALQAGTAAATNQGADLKILNSFFTGNDDANPSSAPVALIGLIGYDVEAVFGVNSSFQNFANSNMFVSPQFAAQNWHFTQCFFDGTRNSHNVILTGTGVKAKFSFTGCWIASAGGVTGGSADAHGVYVANDGTYLDINFTGGRIRDNTGDGVLFENEDIDFAFTGVDFSNNGVTSATYKYGIQFASGVTQTQYAMVSGCRFRGQGTADIRAEVNAKWNGLVGNFFESGISDASSLGWGACQGNVDITTFSVASANALRISPTKDAITVTGAINISSITPTYPNHRITLSFSGALTMSDGSNLLLNGNLVTAAGSVITLICQADGNWREMGRTTT